MADDQADDRHGKHGNAPVFSGDDEDFERWKSRVDLWIHDTTPKEEKQAARIVNSQTNKDVIDLLLNLPEDKLKTKEGVQLILDTMEEHYGKDPHTLAWQTFVVFFLLTRKPGEKATEFVRRLENAYRKIQAYDSEIKINDRTLGMIALLRLDLSETDRNLIITKCPELTPKKIVRAITASFTKDPQSVSQHSKGNIEPTFGEQSFTAYDESSDEAIAYFTQKFGKGPGPGLVCHRCGKKNHRAVDCQTPWEKIERVKKSNGYTQHLRASP